jgi:MoaA/NifB/PqqE/SkfB family radical SAM enzyme
MFNFPAPCAGRLPKCNFGTMVSIGSSVINWIVNKIRVQRDLVLQIDITNACNLRCDHCYHDNHKNQGNLTFSQWVEVLNQYENLINNLRMGPAIILCGGEPLVSTNFKPLIIELNRRWPGILVTVLSNGTLISDQLVEFLKSYNVRFQISLDGPNSIMHDKVRGNGSFASSLKGISKLNRANIVVHILATLSSRNASQIEEFFKLAKEVSADQMNFTRLIVQGYAEILKKTGVDRPLNKNELKTAYQDILNYSHKYEINTNTFKPLYNLIDKDLGANHRLGFQGMVIDFMGNLKVTSRIDYILGNVLVEGLENLYLKHPMMAALRNGEIEVCGSCPHYHRCGGDRNAAFAEYGSFLAKDPGCWIN